MRILKYLFKNITLLNIILLLCILILANYTFLPLLDINLRYTFAATKKTDSQEKLEATEQTETAAIPDYALIAEQNLFHPDRKIPEKKDEKQLPKPEFVLYGTLITDDVSIAYMEDLKAPYNTASRGKRQKAIQKGTVFSGFALTEVHHDKVVMLRGEERIEIKVTEQQHKKERSAALPPPATGAKSDTAASETKSVAEQPIRSRGDVRTSPARTERAKEKVQQLIEKRNQITSPKPQ